MMPRIRAKIAKKMTNPKMPETMSSKSIVPVWVKPWPISMAKVITISTVKT